MEIKMETNILCEVRNIHKWFGNVHALKGVDFLVKKGELVALIGDNGAGKSTLIKIISGVFPASSGETFFEGKKVKIDSVTKARSLGIETVYQDRAVIGDLDVVSNIFLTREKTKLFGPFPIIDRKEMEKEAMEIMGKLSLKISSPRQEVRFCSGGERQGVAIARAMYFNSKLVILDEPTTALSASGVKKVLSFTKHLKDMKAGIIYITHSLHDVYPIVDRFVILIQGEIAGNVKKTDVTVDDLQRLCTVD
jgi:simple sugar transport system ATP-binding protein